MLWAHECGNWPYYGAPKALKLNMGLWAHKVVTGHSQVLHKARLQAQYGAMGPQGVTGHSMVLPQGPQAQYGAMGPQGVMGYSMALLKTIKLNMVLMATIWDSSRATIWYAI